MTPGDGRFAFGSHELDLGRHELYGPDGRVHVEPQVFALLAHLLVNRDRLVTKIELFDEVWGDRFVSESALTSRIKSARQAVGDDGRTQAVIRTVHGQGYRFVADVTEMSGGGSAGPAPFVPSAVEEPAAEPAGTGPEGFLSPVDGFTLEPGLLPSSLRADMGRRFVGRDAELALALAAFGRQEDHDGGGDGEGGSHGGGPSDERREEGISAVWILGEPGIGKTRMAAELARDAQERDMPVLFGRCDEDLVVPYQPFIEVLRGYLDLVPAGDLGQALGQRPSELTRLVPELVHLVPGLEPLGTAGADTEQYRFFEAVSDWLATAARAKGLVLVVDDAHWATRPTVQLLGHLLRNAPPNNVVLVITARDTAPDESPHLTELLGTLSGTPRNTVIRLEGLDLPAVRELVDSDELARRVLEETAGNPLFVDAMTHGDVTGTASDVRSVVQRRLSRLPDEVQDTLRLAAVAGLEFDTRVISEAAGRSDFDVLDDLELAQGARLVDESEADSWRFGHALVRASLRDCLSASRRSRVHARIAAAIETVHAGRLDDQVASLAFHYNEAGGGAALREKAAEYALLEAERAARLLSFDEAISLHDRALELTDPGDHRRRAEILLGTGSIQLRAGLQMPSLASFATAFDEAGAAGDDGLRVRSSLAYEDASWRPGLHGGAALEKLREIAPLVPDEPGVTRARFLAATGRALAFTGEREAAMEYFAEAERMAEAIGDPRTLAQVLAAPMLSDVSGSLDGVARLRALGEELDDLDLVMYSRQIEVRDLARMGRMDEFRRAQEVHVREAEATRSRFWVHVAKSNEIMRYFFDGDLETAERLAEEALVLGGQLPGEDVSGIYGLQMFLIRREQDRLAPVAPLLEHLVAKEPETGMWRPGLAVIHAELGHREAAARLLDELAVDDFSRIPRDAIWSTVMSFMIEVAVMLGDTRRAAILHGLCRDLADMMVMAGHGIVNLGSGARFLGMTATSLGRFEEAGDLLERAVEVNRRGGSPLWTGHARLQRAVLFDAMGERDLAVELAGDVRTVALEHGYAALARRSEELASGGPL